MYKHIISLTHFFVAGDGFVVPGNWHTLSCAQYKPYTRVWNCSPQGESIINYGDIPWPFFSLLISWPCHRHAEKSLWGNRVVIKIFVNINIIWHNSRTLGPGSGLVSMSARFLCIGTFVMRMIPAANASRTLWYAIALCFFLSVDSDHVAFITTLILLQNTQNEPSIGMPHMHYWYCRPSVITVAILIATFSEPKGGSFYSVLFLGEPDYWRPVNINKNACNRMMSDSITCMVSINKKLLYSHCYL